MALTPEDVVNRQFQQTKFREGYDQDEVDDFLDEVVVELRRLNQENQDLTERLAQAEQSTPTAADTPAPVAAVPTTETVAAPVVESAVAPAAVADESESSSSLLQLARRLHDEHVNEGVEKRDQLVAEGNATAARVIAEAEATQREQMAKLNEQRSDLEKKIDQLRQFEREYRQKLRSYIEGQLNELDEDKQSASSTLAGSDTATA